MQTLLNITKLLQCQLLGSGRGQPYSGENDNHMALMCSNHDVTFTMNEKRQTIHNYPTDVALTCHA